MRLLINRQRLAGFSLIEVLVTMVIVVIGLLGVLGLQTKATNSEFEAYQRGQALSLIRNMENRFFASREVISQYVVGSSVSSTDGSVSVGYGDADQDCTILPAARRNLCEWGALLKGSAATEGTRTVGAMLGARGCLIRQSPPEGNALADIFVVVVWRGVVPDIEPPADSPAARCASNVNYGSGLRRGLSLRLLVPDLTQDSTGGGPIYTE